MEVERKHFTTQNSKRALISFVFCTRCGNEVEKIHMRNLILLISTTMDANTLIRITEVKALRVILNNKLTFSPYIQKMMSDSHKYDLRINLPQFKILFECKFPYSHFQFVR